LTVKTRLNERADIDVPSAFTARLAKRRVSVPALAFDLFSEQNYFTLWREGYDMIHEFHVLFS
jgi:hypothetical protein